MSTPINPIATDGLHGPEGLPSQEFKQHESGRQARVARNQKDPETWPHELFDGVYLNTYDEHWRRILKWQESRHFARGVQQLTVDRQRGAFSSVFDTPDKEGNYLSPGQEAMLLVCDHVGPALRALLKELTASNPDFKARPRNDTNEAEAAARIAQEFIDYDAAQNCKPDVRQDEALFGLICGNWLKETYYDNKAGGTIDVPDYSILDIPAMSLYQCADCQQTGTLDELAVNGQQPDIQNVQGHNLVNANCPSCKGSVLMHSQTDPQQIQIPAGSHKESVGLPVSRIKDPSGIVVKIGAKKVSDSTFLYEEMLQERAVLEAMYPWAEIPSEPPSSTLMAQYQLSRSTGSNSSRTGGGYGPAAQSGPFEQIRYERLWLDLCVYQDIEFTRDVIVGDPDRPTLIIKAGVKLGKLFPDGLRMYRVGKRILNWANENKNGRWVHCGYIKNIDGFWCDGIVEKIVQPQKRYNVLDSLMMKSATDESVTTIIAPRTAIDLNKMYNMPGRAQIYIEETFTGEDASKAFGLIPGRELTKEVSLLKESLAGEIEYISGAQPEIQGRHQQGVSTYSEAAMERQQQVGMLGPPSDLRAEAETERLYQVLRLWQEYPVQGQHAFLGKYQNYELQAFYNCDIARDIEIAYSPGSHLPRTMADVMLALQSLATFGGVQGGIFNQEIFPDEKFRRRIIEAHGNPFDVDEEEPDWRNGEKRLQKLKEMVLIQLPKTGFDLSQPAPDPMPQTQIGPDGQPAQTPTNPDFIKWQALLQATVSRIPFQADTDNHPILIEFYTEAMKDDDLEDGPAFLQQCVLAVRQRHVVPVQQAQQQQQEEQAKQGMVESAGSVISEAMKSDTEIERAQLIHGHEARQQQAQRAHEAQMQAADHAHQQQMQQMDTENQQQESE